MAATTHIGTNCAATQPSTPIYLAQRRDRLQWLINNDLPPLPVAPFQDPHRYHKVVKATNNRGAHCPLTKELQPIPLFTGKNPSYLDANGTPHLINHHVYQSRMPSKKELKRWFKHPDNGIGTLGSDRVKWIDIDSKQFKDQAACDAAFQSLLERRTELKLTLLDKTQSGGYRIGVRVQKPFNFTNFSLSLDGTHVGECLGSGRFTVLSPSICASEKSYQSLHNPERIVEIEEIDFLYPTKIQRSSELTKSKNSLKIPSKLDRLPGAIPLELLGHDDSRRVLNGEDVKGDRSESLTTAIAEWAGWLNWCHDNNVTISGTVEALAHYAGEKLGIDSDRINRIIATVDLEQCHPAAHYRGGDEACWRKVKRIDRGSFEANCPDNIKESINGGPPSNRGNGRGGGGGGHHNGDGFLPERNRWNAPVAWNGELGYWSVTKQNKIDSATGEILDEKETVRVFNPKCNFDLEIERELSDAEGGGLVLQVKRSVDHQQRRVIIRSIERLTVKDFNLALTKAYQAGIICNLKTDQLGGLIQTKLVNYRDRGGKVFKLADRIGKQTDGTWVFSDRQLTAKGEATTEDESRTVYNPNLGYEDQISEPDLVEPTPGALQRLVNAMHRFHGDSQIAPAIMTLGWAVACLHFQEIMSIEKRFPLLNLYGDPGCGKTVIAENALSLAGFTQGDGTFCKVTESALYEHLKLSGSLPLLWDDPDKSPWLDTLIQRLYNGKARTVRGNSQTPHTSLMITSNHLIGDNKPAALSRLLPLAIFSSTDGDKTAWDDLVAAQKGASGALPELIGLGYASEEVRALAKELRPMLPHAHCRVADSIALVLHYAIAVCRLSGFDERRIYDYVVGTVCKTSNDSDSASDSLTDFLDKLSSLHAQSLVGEWNVKVVTTKQGFQALAVNLPSVWAKIDGIFKVPYSRRVIESQIAKAGGVLKSAQKFYRSEDEVKAYRRSLVNGHNESDEYVPPRPPDEVTRKCVLIPIDLVQDFVSSWADDDPDDGGGGVWDTGPRRGGSPGGGGETTSSTSYSSVEGNLSEKVTRQNDDETTVLSESSTSSYQLSQHDQNLEGENQEGVQILSQDECGEDQPENNTTSFEEVTDHGSEGCDQSIINDTPSYSSEIEETDDEVTATEAVDFSEIIAEIDTQMKRLDWDSDRGQQYIIEQYGVKSRAKLSDEQLFKFLGYLKSQPKFKVGQTALFRGVKVVVERVINKIVVVVREITEPKKRSFEVAIKHLKPLYT